MIWNLKKKEKKALFRVGMVKTTYNISSVELLTDIHRHRINNK